MKLLLTTLLLSSIFLGSTNTYATVGGGQNIEILGYDAHEQKVYLLRHFEDARGRTPQLYYYNLNSKQPNKLIEVKSIYINPKTNQVDYDNRWKEVTQSIKTIQKRLTPLTSIKTSQIHLDSHYTTKYVTAWQNPQQQAPQYHYKYLVSYQTYKSTPQLAQSYTPNLSVQQAFKIPKHNKVIITIRYLAFPEETGYTTEDPVMLDRLNK